MLPVCDRRLDQRHRHERRRVDGGLGACDLPPPIDGIDTLWLNAHDQVSGSCEGCDIRFRSEETGGR